MTAGDQSTDLASCFAAQDLAWPAAAQQHLKQLTTDETTRCVVTGQQPAIGGGPLYTLVKISHALAIVNQRKAHGEHVVPVFWCASEDHDIGEAGHADFIDRHGHIRRVTSDCGGGRASLRWRPAHQWWDQLVQTAETTLGPGLGAKFLADHSPLKNEGMGQWTCRLLVTLFAEDGLLAIEGHHLRPRWRNLWTTVLSKWPQRELSTLRANLLAAGHPDAFGELDQAPIFHDQQDGRSVLDKAATEALLQKAPDELSPGAALRPVLQQVALPCDTYVAGPGELAYHAFLPPIYDALGVQMPAIQPRCSLTLLPSWVIRALQRWHVTPEAFLESPTAPQASDLPPAFQELRQAIAHFKAVTSDSEALYLADGHHRLDKSFDALVRSYERQRRRQDGVPARGHVQQWLLPANQRQERVMSLFQVIWEHGPGIVRQLVATASASSSGQHTWMRIS